MELGPGDAEAHAALALVLTYAGDHAEAVAAVERSLRLDPEPPDRRPAHRRPGIHVARRSRACDRTARARPRAGADARRFIFHLTLAAAYARAGHLQDARAATADALRLNP